MTPVGDDEVAGWCDTVIQMHGPPGSTSAVAAGRGAGTGVASLNAGLSGADAATLARFFRVLGDATRLRIIVLLDQRERSVGEIVEAVGASQPRVSTHLACLRHCRVATAERRGREVVYRLAIPGILDLLSHSRDVAAPEAAYLATCERVGPDWI